MKTNKLVNTSILKLLAPVCDVLEDIIADIAGHPCFETLLAKDRFMFPNTTSEPWIYYLLSGNLELSYPDGKIEMVSGGTLEAQNPIAYPRTRPDEGPAYSKLLLEDRVRR